MEPYRHQRAFGLLEVVISSGILALVLGAATGLIQASLGRTVLAADRSVAMNLAQEPIEQLRSARDSTFIDNDPTTDWKAFLPDSRCDVDGTSLDIPACSTSYIVSPPNGSNTWNVRPGIDSGPALLLNGQQYTREVYITVPSSPSFVANTGIVVASGTPIQDTDVVRRVHVIVRWNNGAQAVDAATYLTNWRSGS